jgi:hypothetical protein
MATFQVLGTYKVEVTRESLAKAVKHYDWADDWLTEAGNLKDDIWSWYISERADEINTIVMVETNIIGDYVDTELLQFSHGLLQQAPYLEFYLDGTGTETITYDKAKSLETRRICFFLHFFDHAHPINIQQGRKIIEKLSLPSPIEMPERLKPFCYYIPYD